MSTAACPKGMILADNEVYRQEHDIQATLLEALILAANSLTVPGYRPRGARYLAGSAMSYSSQPQQCPHGVPAFQHY